MASVQSARAANARRGALCPKASIPAGSSRSGALVGTGVAAAIVKVIAAKTIGSTVAAVRIAIPVGVPRHGWSRRVVVVGSLGYLAWLGKMISS